MDAVVAIVVKKLADLFLTAHDLLDLNSIDCVAAHGPDRLDLVRHHATLVAADVVVALVGVLVHLSFKFISVNHSRRSLQLLL